jgi:predicted transcriptional regulator of viral defense system
MLVEIFILQNLTNYVIICDMNSVKQNHQKHNERIKATELATWLLSRGVSSATTDDIAALLTIPKNQVPQRLAPLKKRGELVALANGLWAPVPPEYLTWGAPPAVDIIDALMNYLSLDYYVGWLSAAALHGASHHAPQVFQVAVSRAVRAKTIGRSKLQFYQRNRLHLVALTKTESKNGAVLISNKETTMLDIASDIGYVGGISNAANLIIEMCEAGVPDLYAITALSSHYPTSAIRRLGYLMERFADVPGWEQLKVISDQRSATVSLLDPLSANLGVIDRNWMLKINQEVDPDV